MSQKKRKNNSNLAPGRTFEEVTDRDDLPWILLCACCDEYIERIPNAFSAQAYVSKSVYDYYGEMVLCAACYTSCHQSECEHCKSKGKPGKSNFI